MGRLTTSVLIPSYQRPEALRRCLGALVEQEVRPDEVIVVWQGDDLPTRHAAEEFRFPLGPRLIILHQETPGIVPAENRALDCSNGDIILLIDDDAVAPPRWVARHLEHYRNHKVGAVGGPADNHFPDGSVFPKNPREPIGKLTAYGRILSNMHDQPPEWRTRRPCDADHLVGYNVSFRRVAFDRFEVHLRKYWQLFELDACLQVATQGYRVIFDFANVVEHHPTNAIYKSGRHGDLRVKIANAAFNHAFILSKHSFGWPRFWRWCYLFAVGTTQEPGWFGWPRSVWTFGGPFREFFVMLRATSARWVGWRHGRLARQRFYRR